MLRSSKTAISKSKTLKRESTPCWRLAKTVSLLCRLSLLNQPMTNNRIYRRRAFTTFQRPELVPPLNPLRLLESRLSLTEGTCELFAVKFVVLPTFAGLLSTTIRSISSNNNRRFSKTFIVHREAWPMVDFLREVFQPGISPSMPRVPFIRHPFLKAVFQLVTRRPPFNRRRLMEVCRPGLDSDRFPVPMADS